MLLLEFDAGLQLHVCIGRKTHTTHTHTHTRVHRLDQGAPRLAHTGDCHQQPRNLQRQAGRLLHMSEHSYSAEAGCHDNDFYIQTPQAPG